MVFLDSGTHLDGNVTVGNGYKFFIAKYDLNLDYVNSFELPLEDNTGFNLNGRTKFVYDASKHQYYIAGMRGSVTGTVQPLKYDGGAFVERSFILAIDDSDGSEKWRREIYSTPLVSGDQPANCIFALTVDNDSNVYVAGSFHQTAGTPGQYMHTEVLL